MATPQHVSKGWGIARMAVLAVAAGAGAGIISAVWTSRSIEDYAEVLLAGKHLPQISTQKPSPIPGTYEEALSRVREGARTGVATIMPMSVDGATAKDMLHDESAIGYGAIVSDDGWVVVDASVLTGIKNPVREVEVWVAAKRYVVTSVVHDVRTSVVMIHTNATGLSPVGFAGTDGVDSGEMMFAVNGAGGVFPTAIHESDAEIVMRELNGSPVPTFSHAEMLSTEWTMTAAPFAVSAPLVNASGELAGFTQKGTDRAVPLHHALAAIRSIVKTGSEPVAGFGAYVVDLAHAFNIESDLRQNLRAGALILAPDAATHATVRGGPAAEAGFANKDIILAVDGESVTESESLAEILLAYAPGDVAKCTVLRAGQTITISVTLGDASVLLY